MKTSSWVITLFSLLFVALPGTCVYFFVFPLLDQYVYKFCAALGFLVYVFLLNVAFITFKLISIDLVSFAVPLGFVFFALLLSYDLNNWLKALVVLPCVLVAIPCNKVVFHHRNQSNKRTKKETHSN